ncbi:MAG: DUF2330 domain-containing protein [bacterium]|nr:DUF2330 domain-containing protein [bacterium]
MKQIRRLAIAAAIGLLAAAEAAAFCGFYVAKADTELFNRASQVALVRHGDRTVLTMANDFQGDLDEFAIVIPVPTKITRDQIHLGDRALLEHLDAYSSPRLVEYHDSNPCDVADYERMLKSAAPTATADMASGAGRARSLGVTVEAQYTVGEYDISILSARESGGLAIWLAENGYRLPDGAERVLGSYIGQGMRFFVAKVNVAQQSKLGFTYLRPIQVAYESPKFMLPIRLGMLNADGQQELFVYALTKRGRVETTNYRTVKLPSDMDVPLFVKDEFGDFYRDMFAQQVERRDGRAVFLEYAWNMSWCDPCAADPLSDAELRSLGVFWLDDTLRRGAAREVFITRLHVRYDGEHFPEDLIFQETGDTSNFQARYVLRHPWKGDATCSAADGYREQLVERWDRDARKLSELTGWTLSDVQARMNAAGQSINLITKPRPWWKRIWSN